MKISNIHVGTIHRNVRISNWAVSYFHISFIFSYQFHIFISVSYSHLSMYGSYVDVWYFHISFIFSYQFHIFISVCNSHVTTPSLPYVWLRNQSATVRLKQTISPCFTVELITPDEDKRPRRNFIFVLIQCHYDLELIYSHVSHSSPWKTKIN
jgi:hypothetical protein